MLRKYREALKSGYTYQNKYGGSFKCLNVDCCNDCYQAVNITSGWCCVVHGVYAYDDGMIEWDFSTDGYFLTDEEKQVILSPSEVSLKDKKIILSNYFRQHGKPSGCITFDVDTATLGNISVDGSYYGTFDYIRKQFVDIV